MPPGLETSAIARLLRPLARGLTTELASALSQLQADEETQARYVELADKGSEGRLTPEEQAELASLGGWRNGSNHL